MQFHTHLYTVVISISRHHIVSPAEFEHYLVEVSLLLRVKALVCLFNVEKSLGDFVFREISLTPKITSRTQRNIIHQSNVTVIIITIVCNRVSYLGT